MKKGIILIISAMLVFMMAMPAAAQEKSLSVEGTTTQSGHTIFLKVSVTDSVVGDTMGITYSYDASVLEIIPESCSWEKAGVLQDFSNVNAAGVWTANQATDLRGPICVLAFRVLPDTKPMNSTVSCTLLVKKGADDVGTFTAEATVEIICQHQYGQWVTGGSMIHKRTCVICGDNQSQSHSWNNGERQERENATMDLMVYSCSICGGTKQHEVAKMTGTTEETETRPQEPENTTNTGPNQQGGVFFPNQSGSTNQTENQYPNQPGNNSSQSSSNDYYTDQTGSGNNSNQSGSNNPTGENGNSYTNQSNGSIYVPTMPTTEVQDSHEGHDHGDDSATEAGTEDLHAGHNHAEVVVQPAASAGTWLNALIGIVLLVGLLAAIGVLAQKKRL